MQTVIYQCPHCGEQFPAEQCDGLIPTHDFPRPCRAVCPGSGQTPRSVHDRRPLWKDEGGCPLSFPHQPHDGCDGKPGAPAFGRS